jgi:hypothetical protein
MTVSQKELSQALDSGRTLVQKNYKNTSKIHFSDTNEVVNIRTIKALRSKFGYVINWEIK